MQMFRKIIICIFSLCCTVAMSNAQYKEIKVVDDEQKSVTNLSVFISNNFDHIKIDDRGILLLDSLKYNTNDTIWIKTSFYRDTLFSLGDIKDTITLISENHKIKEVSVFPNEAYAYKLVKLFAKSFGKDYAPNYVSKLRFINTTKMNGKYCGFVGVKGLYASLDFNQKSYRFDFNDPNLYSFYNTLPLISLRSYAMYNDKILTKHLKDGNSNYSSTTLRDICNDSAYLEGGQKIYPAAKRALEIYSPLNAKMVSHYNYNINSILDNGDLIVIEFSTRDGIFPKKSRIKVSGIMYCRLSTNTIEKIVVENHIDQYSMLPRMSFNDKTVSATKHRIELNYVRDGNHIYLKKIVANVKWQLPEGVDMDCRVYYITGRNRPYPFKNQLEVFELAEFCDFVDLNEEAYIYAKENMQIHHTFLITNDNIDLIKEFKNGYIDINKVYSDMIVNGKDILQQTRDYDYFAKFYLQHESEYERYREYMLYKLSKIREKIYPYFYTLP